MVSSENYLNPVFQGKKKKQLPIIKQKTHLLDRGILKSQSANIGFLYNGDPHGSIGNNSIFFAFVH